MARATGLAKRSGSVSPTSPSVRSTLSTSTHEPTPKRPAPTRALSGSRVRKAALRALLATAQDLSDRVTETREPWAIRYLEAGRPTSVMAQAPLNPQDAVKLAVLQADQVGNVIRAVLDGLKLSDDDFRRGIDLAIRELRANSRDGWEPL